MIFECAILNDLFLCSERKLFFVIEKTPTYEKCLFFPESAQQKAEYKVLKWIYQSSRIPPTRFATKFALLPMFPTKENVHLDGVAPKVSKAFLLLSTLYTLAHSVRKPTTIIHHASEKIVENEEKSLYFQRRATPRWNRYFSRRAIFFSKQNRQGYCFIQKI